MRGKRNDPKTLFRELQVQSQKHMVILSSSYHGLRSLLALPVHPLIPFSMESDAVTMNDSDITNNRVVKVSVMEKYMASPV